MDGLERMSSFYPDISKADFEQKRHATPGYTANRVLSELSPTMAAALRGGIVSEVKKTSSHLLKTTLRTLDFYSSGYPSKEVPSMTPLLLEGMETWAMQPANDAITIKMRSAILAAMQYGHGNIHPHYLRR